VDDTADAWFLTPDERGNPFTSIDAWKRGRAYTTGNHVEVLVDGATYFRRLYEELCEVDKGDWIHFTDWRGDPDERLAGPGTEIVKVLVDLAERGVHVRGLVWRSHPDFTRFNEESNLHLAEAVNEAGGEILLDERVKSGGSHHQKLFLIRHPGNEDRDVAFVGGIDLCHGRNDDSNHHGDPQPYDLDENYGERPPWHDVQLELRGPVVTDLAITFRERWDDPTPIDHRNPLRSAMKKRAHEPDEPSPLPDMPESSGDGPSEQGPCAVQVLRTYPAKNPPFPFAPDGERSIAHAYAKAYRRARRLLYLEDQYFWSEEIAGLLAQTLRDQPELRMIVVLPRHYEQEGAVSTPPPRHGQSVAMDIVKDAGGDRVGFFDLENDRGTPIYVHAKVCVIDDVWAEVGSDNVNLRSWTHDSELSCSILDETRDEREPLDPAGLGDGARRFARDLRLRLWREHLGLESVEDILDLGEAFETFIETAAALDEWHRAGGRGTRPPGQVRAHEPGRNSAWQRPWAALAYRRFLDPDGRPRALRGTGRF
jgi:phosphatidylserine/phosphatidylglycerophosphate/cardiolipin synthase-like enzyme